MALSVKDAVNIWVERARGFKIREIGAKHEIDPRRIYEIFEGKVHPESLSLAKAELAKSSPLLAQKLRVHKPSLKVIKKAADDNRQGRLL
jgi:hypothetical protein